MSLRSRNRRARRFLSIESPKPVDVDELVRNADEWDRKYLDVTIHALERYDGDRCEELVEEFLGYRNRGAFHSTNPHSKKLWLPELMQEFLALQRHHHGRSWKEALETDVACALVTFTHEYWTCADTNIQFDLQRAKQKVRNALWGMNFIGHFEAAPYRNEQWVTEGVTGNLVSFHCHAIVWGKSRSDLDRRRKLVARRFQPILGNASGTRFDKLDTEGDLATAFNYIGKMPYLGKETFTRKNGKTSQRDCSKITSRSRKNLFHAMKRHDIFEYWLAGGEGTKPLRAARERVKRTHKQKTHRPHGIFGRGRHDDRSPLCRRARR